MTVVIRGGVKGNSVGGGGSDDSADNQPQQSSPLNQNITLEDNGQRLIIQEEQVQFNETDSSFFSERIKSGDENNTNPENLKAEKEQENEEFNFEEANDSVAFPVTELARLDAMISRPRWIIPVLPNGELEILLQTSLNLCKAGLDVKCEPCQRFFREGLTVSFTKILTDEAVSNWKLDIHRCIMQNCEKLIQLCILKLDQDCLPLLDLLAIVFDPNNKFHLFTVNRSESFFFHNNLANDEVYAQSNDPRAPRGWLIDLINRFGRLNGFKKLLERFEKGPLLSVSLISALLKPFGLCYEFLTVNTVKSFFIPIIQTVPTFLENLTDDELKKESKNEAKNDLLSRIVKSLKNLTSRVPNQEETIRNLEIFRLRMILRLLQISSFNGKMNALNEVNKVITNVSFNAHRQMGEGTMIGSIRASGPTLIKSASTFSSPGVVISNTGDIESSPSIIVDTDQHSSVESGSENSSSNSISSNNSNLSSNSNVSPGLSGSASESANESGNTLSSSVNTLVNKSVVTSALGTGEDEDWLTAKRMANWIRENRVLQIVLRDSLHQPQYVEKLEKIIRFVIKEKALTLEDLDDLWAAQCGKHEAIVKNVHDLLAKLAWDFSPEQLDHLFECFRASWTKASKKQREKLLELIRRLAEDDKDGVMAHKVLNLLWNLSHNSEIPTDIMDQALAALVKILDYSCCQDRDSQKTEWLNKCIGELEKEENDWVLPALKLIREICCLYNEAPTNFSNASLPLTIPTTISANGELSNDNVTIPTVDSGGNLNVNLNLANESALNQSSNNSKNIGANESSHGSGRVLIGNENERGLGPLVSTGSGFHTHLGSHLMMYRHEVINRLQCEHSLVVLISENLSNYVNKARQLYKNNSNINAGTQISGSRFSHAQEVQERLSFLRFLLKDGRLWLCAPQAKQIWKCLAENAIFSEDREACFRWFSQLMSEEQDLDPEMNKSFFENNLLKLNSSLITESGIECFDRFFKIVNLKEEKLILNRRTFLTQDLDLIGLDYLWKVVLNCSEEVANSGIELIKEIYTNLGPNLTAHRLEIHADFIQSCIDRLQAFYDTVSILKKDETAQDRVVYESMRMTRVLSLLFEYINQCDNDFGDERTILSMERSFRGKQVSLTIRFPNHARHIEDIQIWTHRNEYLSSVKKQILNKIKVNNPNMRVDLFLIDENADTDINHDEKYVSELPLKDELILSAKLYQATVNVPSSPDSSDSSTSSPEITFDSSLDLESSLPGVIISQCHEYARFFFKLCDLGMALNYDPLCATALSILNIIPADKTTVENLQILCKSGANSKSENIEKFDELFHKSSPTQISYNLMVIYSLLMPSRNPLSEEAQIFQYDFIKSGCGFKILQLLNQENFLSSAANFVKILTYGIVLRISKLVLTCLGYYLVFSSASSFFSSSSTIFNDEIISNIRQALTFMPNPMADCMIRNVAHETAQLLRAKEDNYFKNLALKYLPDLKLIKSIIFLAWATATGRGSSLFESSQVLHELSLNLPQEPDLDIYIVCKEALEVLTVTLMLSPQSLSILMKDKTWHTFLINLLLISSEKSIRLTALEQFSLISTKCAIGNKVLINFIQLLYGHLEATVSVDGYYQNSQEFFQLFCKLLNYASTTRCPFPQAQALLEYEIYLIKNVRVKLVKDDLIEENLLVGHLNITKELIFSLNSVAKYKVGCDNQEEETNDVKANKSKLIIKGKDKTSDKQKTSNEQGKESEENEEDDQLKEGTNVENFLKNEEIGKRKKGLIKILIDEYIFPASKAMILQQRSQMSKISKNSINIDSQAQVEDINPICATPKTLVAAYDCLVALCTGCARNLKYTADTLIEMFYSDNEQALSEWEYSPPIGSRPIRGFAGLKNAGATCYMNSIFQQLFMIHEIRDGILAVEGAATDLSEDFFGEDKIEGDLTLTAANQEQDERKVFEETRKDYNLGVFKYTQAIFGHLALSKLQYYVPRGFWKHFKLWGEPVNLREQHDALEFFNSLVDSIDEALKSLNHPTLMNKVLGGSFADQKICEDCPHRYSREEPFTTLNIDIRNHCNLLDSLEQYVKGDLLEGANAYHCEKCNRKVETVKRLCIKTLPKVLAIQLKRFDYDFERSCAIKFNDYFEFPRVLDMEPYTVRGLAKIEGEIIDDDFVASDDDAFNASVCTKFELCGIVVHSGQASGGHYYSYILYKHFNGTRKWYKFDDGDVTECKLEDDEEMRVQCFGGEYIGEVFDHMLKRMSCRRQKRCWNAYILFYRRLDTQELNSTIRLNELTILESKLRSNQLIKMPVAIRRSVQRQNIKFMHLKNQFSVEYFQFMKNLFNSNGQIVIFYCHNQSTGKKMNRRNNLNRDIGNNSRGDSRSIDADCGNNYNSHCINGVYDNDHEEGIGLAGKEVEEIAMICSQLASKFLFTTCFHTKKTLRGSALEWAELLNYYLRSSAAIRAWFSHNILFSHHYRFFEYLLECPNNDVRSAFGKIIVFLAHFTLRDQDCQVSIFTYGENTIVDAGKGLSDCLMQSVLSLLNKDVSEHSRHLNQYFNLFYQYALIGSEERAQLIRLNVPSTFILIAIDEGPGMPIKYQCADFSELYQVVSLLIRCCDVSSKCTSSQPGKTPLSNPYRMEEDCECMTSIQPQVYDHLYNRSLYVKKLIEETNSTDDTIKLLKFCCWENPYFSSIVLSEILLQIAYIYAYELRPYLDLLYQMLLIEDSWQEHRIHNALRGMQEDREGLFDTINRNKAHYQKRAYQCIKCIVSLLSNCPIATQILYSNYDLKKKWIASVAWLTEELEKRPLASNSQYTYNWSPPAQSNETSNGYYLQRSNSAKLTLSKAFELCPSDEKDDQDDQEMSEESDIPPPPAPPQQPPSTFHSSHSDKSASGPLKDSYKSIIPK